METSKPVKSRNEDQTKAAPFKKKRLRRQKLELEFLRLEAGRMEGELLRLKEMHTQYPENVRLCDEDYNDHSLVAITNSSKTFRLIKPRKVHRDFVWKAIAERQFKERWRAQNQNRELRESLVAEYELGRHLQELFLRSQIEKRFAINDHPARNYTLMLQDDDVVFTEQLLQAEDALLGVDQVLQGQAFAASRSLFIGSTFEKDPDGDAFVTQSNMILPFAPKVVKKGFWSVLGSERIVEHCYEHCVARRTENVIAQSFGIRYDAESIDGDFRCRYTLRHFKDGDRVVIVWVGLFVPVVLQGIRCCGIRCQQIGWAELRKFQSGSVNGTLTRHQSRLTVEADGTKNILPQLVFSLAQLVSEKLSALCGSMLEKSLLEADWKMSNWDGDTSV